MTGEKDSRPQGGRAPRRGGSGEHPRNRSEHPERRAPRGPISEATKKEFHPGQGKRPPFAKGPRGGKALPERRSIPAPELPTARDAARRAYANVARRGAYAAQALDRELKEVHLSEEDRRLAASIFYFAVENRLRLENILKRFLKDRTEDGVLDILTVAAAQLICMDKLPDHAVVDEAVKQTRKSGRDSAAGLVNAVLRNVIRARDAGELVMPDREAEPVRYLSEKTSVAPALAEKLIAVYGIDTAEQIAAWTPRRGAETIRANRLRMNDEEFEAYLTQQGFAFEKSVVPGAYVIENGGRIAAHEGWKQGIFSVQGESSMLAACAVCAKPGMQILDACAAPGGKSCLMAEQMRGSGRVFAWDVYEHRAELVKNAARRLGLENIRVQARDASVRNRTLEYEMDAVLVDAPCSGLGVMGAKPDIKYGFDPERAAELLPIQKAILETCSAYVRVGGLLVYSTCTLLPEENEAQIDAFLEAHPEFEPDTDARWLPEPLRAHYADGRITLLPGRDGVEGFFIARLRRKAERNG